MASNKDEDSPDTFQKQERLEETRDLAGLRPGITENLGLLANPAKSVVARYERLYQLPPEVLQQRFLVAQNRLTRLDSSNPRHKVQVHRIEADIALYQRVARERGIPLDVRDEMELLDKALHQVKGAEKAGCAVAADSASWRRLREDFESLPSGEYSFRWFSRLPMSLSGVRISSHWSFCRPTDPSLRARLGAIILKAAKARGYDSEEAWLDELRRSSFVNFKISESARDRLPDGTYVEYESGILQDAVKHSITLCHILEAGITESSSQPSSDGSRGCVPKADQIGATEPRGDESTRARTGQAVTDPTKSSGKGRKRGPRPDHEGAARVAEIVARVAPDGEWRPKLNDVCEALDEANILSPKRWRGGERKYRSWASCADQEPQLAIKAIEYRLENRSKRTTPETFS
jgi:hypothetical protein